MIWFRNKATGLRSPHPQLREALLCDQSLAQLADLPDDDPDTPLARFAAARASALVGDRVRARRHLHELLQLSTCSTQQQLLAWNCLRELDELPAPAIAAKVRGVVVDIGTPAGLETIAAYEGHTAKLILRQGEVHSTDAPHRACVDAIDRLLVTGRRVVAHTAPHRGPAEAAPESGHACIRVLTFAGTHVGVGPTQTLARDPIGGAVLAAANALQAAMLHRDAEHAG